MAGMNRRAFLLTAASMSRVLGANDRVRLGLIGCGGRGNYVAKFMAEAPGATFVAAADPHHPSAEAVRKWAGDGLATFTDFRKLLDSRELDAVLIATPDHWHALAAVTACEAGKDVYVEKPISHDIWEGRAIVNAARRTKRLVFSGTQQRSAPHFPEIADLIQSGKVGSVRFVRVWNYSNMLPNGIGRAPDGDPPAGLNWDFYLGPAPKVPFNPKRFKSTFRWFWDYAGGTITDYGTHRFDTVHQIMGQDRPKTVSAVGGRFVLNDAGEMPDTLQVTYEYPGFALSYEASNINGQGLAGRTAGMRYYNSKGELDRPHGMAFYGTNATVFADRIGYEIFPQNDKVEPKRTNVRDATSIHAQRFIQAVRERHPFNADIENGHRATTVALLGNIAYKTGEKLVWDAERERVTNSEAANRLLRRAPRDGFDWLS
jgi:predicted dehydrogenase